MTSPIYMDNHATTPTDPRVVEAMMPYFTKIFGNPASSSHSYGWQADEAVENAREQVANILGAHPREIIFTSGATESNNAAIKGVAHMYKSRGRHIVTSMTEHNSVLDSCRALEHDGFEITYLKPGGDGRIRPEDVEKAIRKDTILVSIMMVNNEIGVINPVEEISDITRARKVFFHCDAVQGLGRIPFSMSDVKADFISISGHKVYGPKGAGALYARKSPKARFTPLLHGGGHELHCRSGTLNVPGIVGLGKAGQIAGQEMKEEDSRILGLRELLRHKFEEDLGGVVVNGSLEHRVSGNLNISFKGVEGERLLLAINHKVAVSASSACTSSSHETSHVLNAIGIQPDLLASTIRFGIGRFNTKDEVKFVADLVIAEVRKLRKNSMLSAQ